MIKKERLEFARMKGFTLIEILIVVAIIAILASVVLVGLGPTQQSGRDARRLSDLHEVQNGLELYYNKCGFYPGSGGANCPAAWATTNYAGLSGATGALTTSNIGVTSVPNDPSANKSYFYGSFVSGSTYTIGAILENANNSVFNGYTAPVNVPAGSSCSSPSYCLTL